MEDPRIEYQKFIDQTSSFFFSITLAIPGFLFTIYLNFKNLPDLWFYLLFFGSFLMMAVCLNWWKKIELLASYRDAKIEYLKSSDPQTLAFYTFEKDYLEAKRKERKYKAFLPIEYYDDFYPKFLAMAFLAMSGIAVIVLIIKLFTNFNWPS